MAVKMWIMVFWDVAPCGPVGGSPLGTLPGRLQSTY
jgi:hypothetical protein